MAKHIPPPCRVISHEDDKPGSSGQFAIEQDIFLEIRDIRAGGLVFFGHQN